MSNNKLLNKEMDEKIFSIIHDCQKIIWNLKHGLALFYSPEMIIIKLKI